MGGSRPRYDKRPSRSDRARFLERDAAPGRWAVHEDSEAHWYRRWRVIMRREAREATVVLGPYGHECAVCGRPVRRGHPVHVAGPPRPLEGLI